MNVKLSRVVCLAAAITVLSVTASAALLNYESFDYPAAPDGLAGESGGFGFDGAWILPPGDTNGPDLLTGSLNYTDANGTSLLVSGGRALVDSTNLSAGMVGETVTGFRGVNGALSGVAGSTIYLSFIGRQTAGNERYINLALFGTALQEIIAVGHGNSFGDQRWGAYVEGIGGRGDYSTTLTSTLSFLVLRMDLNVNVTGNDRFRLYVNPILGIEPLTADVDVTDYDLFSAFNVISQIRIGAGNSTDSLSSSQMEIDEIRMADTYASVAPVPEPSATVLLAGTLAALALRRLRRRGPTQNAP